jgi:hypothetical protein
LGSYSFWKMARGECQSSITELGLSAGSFSTQVCSGLAHNSQALRVWTRVSAVLLVWSFCSCVSAQASAASKARRGVLVGAILLSLAAVAAVAMIGGEAVKAGEIRMELSDQNEFPCRICRNWSGLYMTHQKTYQWRVVGVVCVYTYRRQYHVIGGERTRW